LAKKSWLAISMAFIVKGDAYSMTFVLGLNQNHANPKILQILIQTMCGKICENLFPINWDAGN
jgi:hypothetical protein